ncbi:MAG: DUF4365 domain-containing protein [Bacteroidia bacterium]
MEQNMLTRNQIESELSLAYLQAVAANEGFAVDVPHIDSDSVDAVIAGKGKVDVTSTKHSPKIEVQLKATFNAIVNDGNIAYSLTIKNYDDLRVDTVLPRLLVLLVLPQQQIDWLIHQPDKLILQKCAYYLNLKGLPTSVNAGHQTVYIPTLNMLTPAALKDLMIKASKLEDL